jgi:hypothetical protein
MALGRRVMVLAGGKYGEIAKALLFSKLKFKGMSQLFRE